MPCTQLRCRDAALDNPCIYRELVSGCAPPFPPLLAETSIYQSQHLRWPNLRAFPEETWALLDSSSNVIPLPLRLLALSLAGTTIIHLVLFCLPGSKSMYVGNTKQFESTRIQYITIV